MSELNFWASVAKLLLALPAVILLAYLSLRLTATLSRERGGASIEIIEKTALNKNQYLCIVKVGERYHLVGTSEHGMTLLRDVEDHEIVAKPIPVSLKPAEFRAALTQAMSRVRRSS